MFATPVVCNSYTGEVIYHDGLIYKLPPELSGKTKIDSYAALTKSGWHEIDFAYLAYVYISPDRTRYCFPGILPLDISIKNRFKVPQMFSKKQFEEYVRSILEHEDTVRGRLERDLNLLVHDLRQLSGVIYNAAEEAKSLMQEHHTKEALVRIENIIAAQSMLKIRTDVLDFTGNPDESMENNQVPLFRKVDKVVRCFRPIAERYGVDIDLKGTSFSTSFGPDVFEIIPYILIDNSVKYAPRNNSVNVSVNETSSTIELVVISIGPNIKPFEKDLVFERGYRGEEARSREDSGSGLGLFLCKKMVGRFSGSISVEVGEKEISTSKGPSRELTFMASFPKTATLG